MAISCDKAPGSTPGYYSELIDDCFWFLHTSCPKKYQNNQLPWEFPKKGAFKIF